MTTLVITVVGDDRTGLVSELADVVAEHGGSWGRSQLTELAGTFAGIVTVDLPRGRVDALTAALEPLAGVLTTTVHEAVVQEPEEAKVFRLELVGNDRPGIVKEVSSALSAQGVSIDQLDTRTGPAPMSGGELFEVSATLRPTERTDLGELRQALERLAGELMVDISLETEVEDQ